MLKFLVAPSFKFATDLIARLPTEDTDEVYKRILIHPITNGLRLRNLEHTLSIEFELLSGLVKVTWCESIEHGNHYVPYRKLQSFSPVDIDLIASTVVGFFERKWGIEKDA